MEQDGGKWVVYPPEPGKPRAWRVRYAVPPKKQELPEQIGPGPAKREPSFSNLYLYDIPTPEQLERAKINREKTLKRRRAVRRAIREARDGAGD